MRLIQRIEIDMKTHRHHVNQEDQLLNQNREKITKSIKLTKSKFKYNNLSAITVNKRVQKSNHMSKLEDELSSNLQMDV